MKNNTTIKKIAKKIIEGTKPEKIVLFGSYAQGNPSKSSDIDLLVIKNSNLRRDERDLEIRKYLKDIIFPLDIFVYSKNEVDKYKKIKGSFINKILKTGKVLYEQKQPL